MIINNNNINFYTKIFLIEVNEKLEICQQSCCVPTELFPPLLFFFVVITATASPKIKWKCNFQTKKG